MVGSVVQSVLLGAVLGGTVFIATRATRSALEHEEPTDTWPAAVTARWTEIEAGGTPVGPAEGAVTIVDFSDFQCQFCAGASAMLKAVAERRPGVVTVRLRHFPLTTIHPFAVNAAHASECAGEQGRFAEYAEALFRKQHEIGTVEWERFAGEAAVPDVERFRACQRDGTHRARIEEDSRLARELHLPGTPVIVIDGQVLTGQVTEARLEAAIESALAAKGRGGAAVGSGS